MQETACFGDDADARETQTVPDCEGSEVRSVDEVEDGGLVAEPRCKVQIGFAQEKADAFPSCDVANDKAGVAYLRENETRNQMEGDSGHTCEDRPG